MTRTPSCSARSGGPKLGHHRSVRPAARAGAARAPKGPGPLREPSPGAPEPGARRGESAARRTDRGHGPARRPRADRRHLLRGQRARWRRAHDTCEYSVAEIERIARVGFDAAPAACERRRARAARHLGRQGERARDVTALAGDGGRAWPSEYRRGRAGPHAGRQRGDAARVEPRPFRRPADREHVRRHPQRRVGDADRLARDAPVGEPRRHRPGLVRARPRIGARTSRARASPTRSRPSCRRR